MLAATGIAIFLIPVLFVLVEKLTHRGKAKQAANDEEASGGAGGCASTNGALGVLFLGWVVLVVRRLRRRAA